MEVRDVVLIIFLALIVFGSIYRFRWVQKKAGKLSFRVGYTHEGSVRILGSLIFLFLGFWHVFKANAYSRSQDIFNGLYYVGFAIFYFFLPYRSLEFRLKGLVAGIHFVAWDRVRFYIWDHLDPNHLSITWGEGKDKTKTFDLDVKPKQRDEVLRILKERTDAEEVRAE